MPRVLSAAFAEGCWILLCHMNGWSRTRRKRNDYFRRLDRACLLGNRSRP